MTAANFGFLQGEDPQLLRLATLAERYFHDDPSTALIKLRQFAETLARIVAARNGLLGSNAESLDDVLRALRHRERLPREAADLFHGLRRLGNAAVHEGAGGHSHALSALKLARELGIWFARSYGGRGTLRPGPFIPPSPPPDATRPLLEELKALRSKLDASEQKAQAIAAEAEAHAAAALSEAARTDKEAADARFWREYAEQTEAENASLSERLAAAQAAALASPPVPDLVQAAETASAKIVIDEADTRALVDAQLSLAGWEADTARLRWSEGVRPEIGRLLAIAEWPTDSGPVDYALFVDDRCVGVVEAKRRSTDVPAVLRQAQRYARDIKLKSTERLDGAPWTHQGGEGYRAPFVFATNGRPFLKQLETKSGIWFWDARRESRRAIALDSWFSPADLTEKLAQVLGETGDALAEAPFEDAALRPYQRAAVAAIEQAIDDGRREILVAMATGTGKTRTCLALMYRLLKRRRFRRILFLVDREALGRQALDALNTTETEGLLKFSQAYGVAGFDQREPRPADRVHVATVQSLVRRLFEGEEDQRPTPGRYDLIVVDEAHRGYTLDAEMREADLGWRDTQDYLSKYRRVLEHFDAVKVALTATPALHTVQIFGHPVFHYGYRQAVVDGFLIDHLPPRRITTALSQAGITFEGGAEVELLDPRTGQIDLFQAPDQIDFDVAAFNRRVYTREFNRVVAEALAVEIPPNAPGKTLIFAARDDHADMLVEELRKALEAEHGPQPAGLVEKITGSVDRPLDLIRSFQNDARPKYVVTVDLLTTGIDVPPITNLVFVRRVNSRILYDQMIGRATRLYPGKSVFRIFDAVDLYAKLQGLTEMRPVVVDPGLTFQQLAEDFARAPTDEDRRFVRDQIVVKLRQKLNRFSEAEGEAVQRGAGRGPAELLDWIKDAPIADVLELLKSRPTLAPRLDDGGGEAGARDPRIPISPHQDMLVGVEDVFTGASGPEDYISNFERYVRENINAVPALVAAVQRPRELTRKELKALAALLDAKGFSEAELRRAYGRARNADIAAHVLGFVRQAALGDPLVPYATRVQNGVDRLLASRAWMPKQAQWLRRIGRALIEQPVGDPEILDAPAFRQQGGWATVDADFDGRLGEVLGDLNEAIWA